MAPSEVFCPERATSEVAFRCDVATRHLATTDDCIMSVIATPGTEALRKPRRYVTRRDSFSVVLAPLASLTT